MTISTDLQMIQEYKTTNRIAKKQQIEADLYNKYMPLIKTESRLNINVNPMEDNMQECYIIMKKALEYVNPDKIYNKEVYTFGVTFKSYLRAYFKAIYIKKGLEWSTYEHVDLCRDSSDMIKENMVADSFNRWFNTLDKFEQKIIEFLEKGLQRQEIAKKLKMKNTANLTYHTNRLKRSYKDFMNTNGYSIA